MSATASSDVPDMSDREHVSQPHPNDLLLGRGGGTEDHPRNIKFRKIVKDNFLLYRTVATNRVKQKLAREIIDWVRKIDPPGRFLKYDDYDGAWRVVGDEEALKKIRQELRGYSYVLRKEHYLDKNHPLEGVSEEGLHQNDVLYGLGGRTNHHPGNKMFRKMVEERKQQYRNERKH